MLSSRQRLSIFAVPSWASAKASLEAWHHHRSSVSCQQTRQSSSRLWLDVSVSQMVPRSQKVGLFWQSISCHRSLLLCVACCQPLLCAASRQHQPYFLPCPLPLQPCCRRFRPHVATRRDQQTLSVPSGVRVALKRSKNLPQRHFQACDVWAFEVVQVSSIHEASSAQGEVAKKVLAEARACL